jgi:hypothetical protein
MPSLHSLLRGAIDYAGLFPPAGLGMAEAVRNYSAYREGEDAWALGRFVVPATRVVEFESAAAPLLPRSPSPSPWRVAALIGPDVESDLRTLDQFNCRHAAEGEGAVAADVVEGKAESIETIAWLLSRMPSHLQAYVEVPIAGDPARLIAAIGAAGGRAKVRTGGITADAFPPAADLVRFIRCCLAAGVPFKATAGLHHPLRAEYRLTHEPGSACGTMFGFLNLFLATGFIAAGLDDREAGLLLEEGDRDAFRFDDAGVEWRGRRLDAGALRRARETGMVAFGSCSFIEPLGDLESLGLLQVARGR